MDKDDLKKELEKLNVTTPDMFRAALYLDNLKRVSKYLLEGDKKLGPNAERFNDAFSDPELLEELSVSLDNFVVCAVNADLDKQTTPNRENYQKYFINNILGKNYTNNVKKFYLRYPSTERAITKMTENFINNITEACQRINNNWGDIQRVFLNDDNKIEKLIKIRSTGSDFHKGGKQVLILTFRLNTAISITDVNEAEIIDELISGNWNLIYKPSDVEIDCLITGKSVVVNDLYKVKKSGKFMENSLFEIINNFIPIYNEKNPNACLQKIPTYKIIPYNCGSKLENLSGDAGIRSSYGYIEYIENSEEEECNIFNCHTFGYRHHKIFPHQDDDGKIKKKFYKIIGELLAVAGTFSITDLHMENLIVSHYMPYLIDLEVSLTASINDIKKTSLFEGFGGITGIYKRKYKWDIHKDKSGSLVIEKIEKEGGPFVRQNRLWNAENLTVIDYKDYTIEILKGYKGCMYVLMELLVPPCQVIQQWTERLDKVVVRYTPVSTLELIIIRDRIYGDVYCDKIEFVTSSMKAELKERLDKVPRDEETQNLNYIVFNDSQTETDFKNCDIPSYYHRIGSCDIMNSNGIIISVPPSIKCGDEYISLNVKRTTFFPDPPTKFNVINDQVLILQDEKKFQERVKILGDSIAIALGLKTSESE